MSEFIKTTVSIEPEQLEELKKLSSKSGLSVAALIRIGVTEVLRTHCDDEHEGFGALAVVVFGVFISTIGVLFLMFGL